VCDIDQVAKRKEKNLSISSSSTIRRRGILVSINSLNADAFASS
jgi:hypothetical protein